MKKILGVAAVCLLPVFATASTDWCAPGPGIYATPIRCAEADTGQKGLSPGQIRYIKKAAPTPLTQYNVASDLLVEPVPYLDLANQNLAPKSLPRGFEALVPIVKAVDAILVDPYSAHFGPVTIWELAQSGGGKIVVTCGFVNAKDNYGGYAGNTMYAVIGYHKSGVIDPAILAELDGESPFALGTKQAAYHEVMFLCSHADKRGIMLANFASK